MPDARLWSALVFVPSDMTIIEENCVIDKFVGEFWIGLEECSPRIIYTCITITIVIPIIISFHAKALTFYPLRVCCENADAAQFVILSEAKNINFPDS